MRKWGKKSQKCINGLHDILQYILNNALQTSPYDFGIHEGERSLLVQQEYYKQGRTKPGNIVTWIDGVNKKGYHNYSPALAFDFHCSVKGHTWDDMYLEAIAEHILEVAAEEFVITLVWGGNWETPDRPHIQLPFKYKKEMDEILSTRNK